jgi:hypothetical protein
MSDTSISSPKVVSSKQTILFHRDTEAPAVDRTAATTPSETLIDFETRGSSALAPVIEIDRLYEAAPGTSSNMVRALELLRQASDDLNAAQKADDAMEADRLVQRAQLLLPKLFALRSVGDGFGVIVNSLHFAFANRRGIPLTADQLNVVWRALKELRVRPAMSLEQGIQRVEELEEKGLDVDPADLGDLIGDLEAADGE